MSRVERKALIRRDQPELSLSRQCEILAISRSSFYYTPKGESPANLALMRRIDELFLKYPFYGSRQMVRQLQRDGTRSTTPIIEQTMAQTCGTLPSRPQLDLPIPIAISVSFGRWRAS